MKDPLQAVKVVSWQSIIIGSFMALKIPESLLFIYIIAKLDNSFATSVTFSDSVFILASSILAISVLLIASGYFLLQKKVWARNVLETIFWLLLVFICFNIIQIIVTIFSNISALSATDSVYGLSLIPFLLIGALLIFNLYLLRHKKVKRVLS